MLNFPVVVCPDCCELVAPAALQVLNDGEILHRECDENRKREPENKRVRRKALTTMLVNIPKQTIQVESHHTWR